ncbi:MAG: dihydroorotate dehydrogenase electron transfer subunit [Eubacteriales bacterium]|nr:dihydroorotate dehydrogenase electron transfer subunit [Christensenellaceae bacterium]MCI7769637.1 dihydroorotate dehydrogenase electron transfer subunit [Christensenellaceae bacterium]MDD6361335.1 dihydroorotate dehydrogenase electron transfer subunit [Christensenellaceae bacterium]MDY6078166.1 dihydroorotate dehydrogenase electron transfer subunit [Eubacteriales bacterium]
MERIFPKVTGNAKIAENTYEMRLSGDFSSITAPGQFVNFAVEGCYLRRPISVCDVENGILTVVYKTVGKGTEIMSRIRPGETMDVLSGLGNGYDVGAGGERPLLIGGGAGVPPMYMLCKALVRAGARPVAVLGFNSRNEVFYEDEFKAAGAETHVTTVDGSYGIKGYVTDVIGKLDYTYFYACGPEAMFKAVEKTVKSDGEYSFEERMGCGFGACMGCSCKTKYGSKRICKDGPVLKRGEIIW